MDKISSFKNHFSTKLSFAREKRGVAPKFQGAINPKPVGVRPYNFAGIHYTPQGIFSNFFEQIRDGHLGAIC
jgi:hypothetical protein